MLSGTRHLVSRLLTAIRGADEIVSGPARGLRFDAYSDTPRFTAGDYEASVQECIARALRPGDVCYDIGANLGFFTILMSRLTGSEGKVYAFEPVPHNAAIVARNARLNHMANVTVVKAALSDTDGTSELLLAKHSGGAVLKGAGTPPDLVGSLTVRTARLDSLIDGQALAGPMFVKIDVEGAELAVLQGMQRTLQQQAPKLLLELDDAVESECDRKLAECRAFLEQRGYETQMLSPAYPDNRWFVKHFLATPARR
jgi:FkbM family methyltransferase